MKFLSLIMLLTSTMVIQDAYSAHKELLMDLSQNEKPATIKVLISQNKESLLVEAKGSYGVYDPVNQLLLCAGTVAKRERVTFHSDGIIWGEQFASIPSIRIVPQDAECTILVDGIEYRGCVEIRSVQGKLHVINEIDLERFLKSTLTFCFSEEWDNEVLEAVAIAARTQAHFLVSHDASASWHVSAKDADYHGSALTLQNLQMEQAIHNTRNMILTYKGASFPAAWTKNSAGQTANFSAVFRREIKSPQGVVAPVAAKERDKHIWSFEITKRELARVAGTQKVTDIALFQDKESKKVYAMRVKNGDEIIHNIDFFTLQKAIGDARLKSNDFTLEVKGEKIAFTGYGEGHGVGLCLLSAAFYADKGEKAQQILTRFFPNTQLQHLDNRM
jgi:stage II sporulation protein D